MYFAFIIEKILRLFKLLSFFILIIKRRNNLFFIPNYLIKYNSHLIHQTFYILDILINIVYNQFLFLFEEF